MRLPCLAHLPVRDFVVFLFLSLITLVVVWEVFVNVVECGATDADLSALHTLQSSGAFLGAHVAEEAVCSRFEDLGLYEQAEEDFGRYERTMTPEEQEQYAWFCEKYAKGHQGGCITVTILDGRVFVRHFYSGYQSRARATLHAIYRVAQRFGPLPNAQFVIEVTDGNYAFHGDLPVFHITRPRDRREGILYPDFTFYSWPEAVCPPERTHAFGYLYDIFHRRAREADLDPDKDWAAKKDLIFWRGGQVASQARAIAHKVLNKAPHSDVEYMGWLSTSITGTNGAPGCVSLVDHCKYRYLAFLDGNTYSSRFKYQLFCGSAVFANQQNWVEWWSRFITPDVDYVEVKPDWTDALERLAELRQNPDVARKVGQSGRNKVLNVLSEDAVDCYWLRLIEKAAAVLPPPKPLDFEQLPSFTKPIEDALLFGDDVTVSEDQITGPIVPVR